MRPDVHRVSDLEVQGRESVFIGLGLVAGLSFGDVPPEFRVEFVQVYREFQGASGGYVAFRVYRKLKLNVGSGQAMSRPGLNLHLTCEYVTYRFRYSYHELAVDLSQGSEKHQTHCRYL